MDTIKWFDTQLYAFFVADSQLLRPLILLVVLDYITGVCVAIHTRKLSSQIGAKGITKKIAIFVVIAFCHILDTYLISAGAALESITTLFYLTNESISIFENVKNLGVPLPKKLCQVLQHLKDTEKKGMEDTHEQSDPPSNHQKLSHKK